MKLPLQGTFQSLRQKPPLPCALPGIGIVLLVLLLLFLPWSCRRGLPDFSKIDDTKERKEAFFSFLGPYIEEANAGILASRKRLQAARDHLGTGRLNRRESRWVRHLASRYELELDADADITRDLLDGLLLRVDIIPPSMALAQAALESGWGTSRFAQQGNNLFGIWCYEPGCGIVPRRRPAGASHEVKAYRSPRQSFEDYISNLNTNRAYESLWRLRADARGDGTKLTGVYLADGLYRYSREGWTYVGKVQRMIRSNKLLPYDEKYH